VLSPIPQWESREPRVATDNYSGGAYPESAFGRRRRKTTRISISYRGGSSLARLDSRSRLTSSYRNSFTFMRRFIWTAEGPGVGGGGGGKSVSRTFSRGGAISRARRVADHPPSQLPIAPTMLLIVDDMLSWRKKKRRIWESFCFDHLVRIVTAILKTVGKHELNRGQYQHLIVLLGTHAEGA
jgi:hypothetical protein